MDTTDEEMMRRAISLAMQGRLSAPPNPWVGCVIVKHGQIIGEGYHQRAGEPHAETIALQQAGQNAKGATVYVTLEPCAHFGRTPPCVNALINAQVSQVMVGLMDPDLRVSGKGIEQLEKAGIFVKKDLLSNENHSMLEPYLHHRKTGRPFCIAKAGVSMDGRIAASNGSSQWITCPEARADVHQLRAESQAILIGTSTAIHDNPSLTARDVSFVPPRQPLRVILDAKGRVRPQSPLFDPSLAPTLVVTSSDCDPAFLDLWKQNGADIFVAPKASNGIDLCTVMDELGKRRILQLLVEGGGTLLTSMLKAKLIDCFQLYVGPCILGDNGVPLFKNFSIPSMQEAIRMEMKSSKNFGSTVKIEYRLKN